jgi:hypothetical protein
MHNIMHSFYPVHAHKKRIRKEPFVSALLVPVLFAAIAMFALAAIVDACLQYGRQALALPAQVKRINAAVECRWIVAGASSVQPMPARAMGRPGRGRPAGHYALRAAA